MTVIAFRDGVLAADKRSLNNRVATAVTKIFRAKSERALLAISGDLAHGMELINWFNCGAKQSELPVFQRGDGYVPMLVVRPDGLWMYEDSSEPFRIERDYYAMGSGRDCALAAMRLGCSAKEAVEITSEILTCCGNGVDTLELD